LGGTIVVLVFGVLMWRFHTDPSRDVGAKAQRIELVEQMRRALASAAEAEKSAVMAITDQDSQTYADQARAATAEVERDRNELSALLQKGSTQKETELLIQFTKEFSEFQRVDKELLDLAVRNTNLKASALAFGPAREAMNDMDAALSRLLNQNVSASSPSAKKVMMLAASAESAALRIMVLLPPHIAEESDKKMDDLEAAMAKEDDQVRGALSELGELLPSNKDVETARASYARFGDLKKQILKLSRENTNVRSLSMSLNEKRKVMGLCQEALAALEAAIQEEPTVGRPPVSPR
jgi:hypothetical protein